MSQLRTSEVLLDSSVSKTCEITSGANHSNVAAAPPTTRISTKSDSDESDVEPPPTKNQGPSVSQTEEVVNSTAPTLSDSTAVAARNSTSSDSASVSDSGGNHMNKRRRAAVKGDAKNERMVRLRTALRTFGVCTPQPNEWQILYDDALATASTARLLNQWLDRIDQRKRPDVLTQLLTNATRATDEALMEVMEAVDAIFLLDLLMSWNVAKRRVHPTVMFAIFYHLKDLQTDQCQLLIDTQDHSPRGGNISTLFVDLSAPRPTVKRRRKGTTCADVVAYIDEVGQAFIDLPDHHLRDHVYAKFHVVSRSPRWWNNVRSKSSAIISMRTLGTHRCVVACKVCDDETKCHCKDEHRQRCKVVDCPCKASAVCSPSSPVTSTQGVQGVMA